MSMVERHRVGTMLKWCLTVPQTQKVKDRKKELLLSYRRFLLVNADTFEALVIKTLLV